MLAKGQRRVSRSIAVLAGVQAGAALSGAVTNVEKHQQRRVGSSACDGLN